MFPTTMKKLCAVCKYNALICPNVQCQNCAPTGLLTMAIMESLMSMQITLSFVFVFNLPCQWCKKSGLGHKIAFVKSFLIDQF